MHRRRPSLTATLVAVAAGLATLAAPRPQPELHLVLSGLTQGYLEPCNCGGQRAGGLARRAGMIAALRRERPGLLVVDVGELIDPAEPGNGVGRLPVITRAVAYLGVSAVALGNRDLAAREAVVGALREAAVPATLLTAPGDAGLAERLVIDSHGVRLGLISVAHGVGTIAAAARGVQQGIAGLRDEADLVLLVSHLGRPATEQIVAGLPATAQPAIVAVATGDDEPPAPRVQRGVAWVSLARRGRSLAVVNARRDDGGWTLAVDLQPVADGPVDPLVQSWVDDHFARERSAAPPADADQGVELCLPCHAKSVAGWRRHPHAHAVATLVAVGRDVPGCLHCHSTAMRTAGRRAEDGVGCGGCHGELTRHLDGSARPTTIGLDGCRGCHTSENSPAWDADEFRRDVRRACLGVTAPRRAVAPRKR